jgi:hypothetical protein
MDLSLTRQVYISSPRNRVAQLYPQALGSLFVSSYVSQGYGGGIRTRLHEGTPNCLTLTAKLLLALLVPNPTGLMTKLYTV